MRRNARVSVLIQSVLLFLLPVLVVVPDALAPTETIRTVAVGNSLRFPREGKGTPVSKEVRKGLRIRLACGEFDPMVESMPRGGIARLVVQNYAPGERGGYIVQFNRPITATDKKELEKVGARVFDYLPDFSFIVNMDEATRAVVATMKSVRWVGIYQPAYKVYPTILTAMTTSEKTATEEFIITIFQGEDPLIIAEEIKQLGGEILDISENSFTSKIRTLVDLEALREISRMSSVRWIEPAPVWKLLNDVAAEIIGVPNVWNMHNLHGAGQVVAVADTGLDQGESDPDTLHDDFEDGNGVSRVSQIFDWAGDGASSDVNSGHGTHVAGSVLGNGSSSGSDPVAHDYTNSYAGVAPETTLVFQAVEDNATGTLTGIPLDLGPLFQEAYDASARIHTNSWGSSQAGAYTSFSEDVD